MPPLDGLGGHTPRTPSYKHGDHTGSEGGTNVVVQPIAYVGDLLRWAAAFANDLGKEPRRRQAAQNQLELGTPQLNTQDPL